jgi:hypothetical protein
MGEDDGDIVDEKLELNKQLGELSMPVSIGEYDRSNEQHNFFHDKANAILAYAHPSLVEKYRKPGLCTKDIPVPKRRYISHFTFTNPFMPIGKGGRRIKSNIRKINKTLSKVRKNKRTKSIRKNRRSYRRY